MINKKKLFISGGNGMVGKNIIENIDQSEYEIIAPRSSELNLLEYNSVKCFLEKIKPDFVIHCAGKVGGIQANIKDSYGFFLENMLMGLNLVRASKEVGIKNFLNLSSSCSYPCEAQNPLKEDYVFAGKLEPTNEGYAIAKASILKMCEFITRQFEGFNYKTVVPCNLYGRWDKFGEQNSHMIPAVIKKMHYAKVNNLKKIEIWGDGLARREFMYATDLAFMIIKVLENFERVPVIMNLGLGYDYTVNEYYEIIAKIVGYNGELVHDLTKPSGMMQKLLDVTKQKELGIIAKTTLEEGVRATYDFYLNEYKGE